MSANDELPPLLMPFLPPDGWAVVEPKIYRAAFLGVHHIHFLRSRGIKTVVNMSTDKLSQHVVQGMGKDDNAAPWSGEAITLLEPCAPSGGPMMTASGDEDTATPDLMVMAAAAANQEETRPQISDEIAKEALELILEPKHQPLVLTMAAPGGLEVCTLVGCLRRLQGWALTAVLYEFKIYAPTAPMYDVHRQFVERFDVSIVTLPQNPPDWLSYELALLEEEIAIAEDIERDEASQSENKDADGARQGGANAQGAEGSDDNDATDDEKAMRLARRTHERFYYCPTDDYVPLKSSHVSSDQLSTVIKHDADGD